MDRIGYRFINLERPVEAPEEDLRRILAARLGVTPEEILEFRILRKSLDARKRNSLKYVYSFFFKLEHAPKREFPGLSPYQEESFHDPDPGRNLLFDRPVIVGSGPAGLLAGYYLAQKGFRPLILERGEAVKHRVPAIRKFDRGGDHDPENNYLFGEGGAGCFSDGKLTCRLSGPDVDWVLERFVETGGKPSIRYEHRPHLGSNRLPLICRNFRRRIEAMGGEYRFGCKLEGLRFANGRLHGVETSSGFFPASLVVLAIGHSARDTYEKLYELGLPFEQKAFQLGLRIEHPQENVNRHKYGKPSYLQLLGAADYTLTAKGKRDLYSFCMCAGGIVIPSISEPGRICTNGMSHSKRNTAFANSGLMVTLKPEEFGSTHPLAGMHVQRKYEAIAFRLTQESYLCPIQPAEDFLRGRSPSAKVRFSCSYERGVYPTNLHELLPPLVVQGLCEGLPKMDEKWSGDFLKDAILVGPEMRGSSPVRIPRDPGTFQTPDFTGLYPVGEGAGYAGGIISAAVDGLRAARKIVEDFRPNY